VLPALFRSKKKKKNREKKGKKERKRKKEKKASSAPGYIYPLGIKSRNTSPHAINVLV
jgi:polyferredoxin